MTRFSSPISLPSSMEPFLQKLQERSPLGEAERKAILGLPFHPRHVAANGDFVQQGQAVRYSSFVLEGLVGMFGQNRRGERQFTALFIGGDMIDLQSVVVPTNFASLQAITTSTLLLVPHAALRHAAEQFPRIAEAFWRECVMEAALLNEWVLNVGRRDARSRLAHLFCELACRTGRGTVANGFCFPFAVTQQQLADMLGLTPVHVNRTLKGLREDNVLEFSHRNVRISNWDRLAQIGEFEPSYLRLGTGSHTCE